MNFFFEKRCQEVETNTILVSKEQVNQKIVDVKGMNFYEDQESIIEDFCSFLDNDMIPLEEVIFG